MRARMPLQSVAAPPGRCRWQIISKTYTYVALEAGGQLLVALPGTSTPTAGTAVWLSWDEADAVMLAGDLEAAAPPSAEPIPSPIAR